VHGRSVSNEKILEAQVSDWHTHPLRIPIKLVANLKVFLPPSQVPEVHFDLQRGFSTYSDPGHTAAQNLWAYMRDWNDIRRDAKIQLDTAKKLRACCKTMQGE